jgi:hypothetical protein
MRASSGANSLAGKTSSFMANCRCSKAATAENFTHEEAYVKRRMTSPSSICTIGLAIF